VIVSERARERARARETREGEAKDSPSLIPTRLHAFPRTEATFYHVLTRSRNVLEGCMPSPPTGGEGMYPPHTHCALIEQGVSVAILVPMSAYGGSSQNIKEVGGFKT
jgi:hypothetical protein